MKNARQRIIKDKKARHTSPAERIRLSRGIGANLHQREKSAGALAAWPRASILLEAFWRPFACNKERVNS
jgi:hypothetical protein